MRIGYIGCFDNYVATEKEIRDSLIELGHDVTTLDPRNDKNFSRLDKSDLVITSIPTYLTPQQIESLPSPKIFWGFDAIYTIPERVKQYVPKMKLFDACFTPEDVSDWYKSQGVNHFYLQQGFHPSYYYPVIMKRTADVGFLGQHTNKIYHAGRQGMLDEIGKICKLEYFEKGIYYSEASKFIGSCKIMLCPVNLDIPGYWSRRIYQYLGSGAFCLHQYQKGLENEFTNNEHLVWWHDLDELKELVKYYLKNDKERKRISDNGYKYVSNHYTFKHRAKQVLKEMSCDKPIYSAVSKPKKKHIKVGMVAYTNRTSGVGVFCWEFLNNLPLDSILSVGNRIKGQEQWIDRQLSTAGTPTARDIEKYINRYKPDAIFYIETPFNKIFKSICDRHSIKLAGFVMCESVSQQAIPRHISICPHQLAYGKISHPNKIIQRLPIDTNMFPFRERGGRKLMSVVGYEGLRDRKQRNVIERLDNVKIYSQVDEKSEETKEPWELYKYGDISLALSAFGGYERTIPESMASGLITIGVDGPPMNEFYEGELEKLLIKPCEVFEFSERWVYKTLYHKVALNDLQNKIKQVYNMSEKQRRELSRLSRQHIEDNWSWQSKKRDFRREIMDILER